MTPRNLIFMVGILVVAMGLRTWRLDKFPVGLTTDEAALGYNAYNLQMTGRDEWGTVWWRLPFINLKSFGDYKLPLYSFLSVPSIAALGLNVLAVRIPNMVVGSLAVLAVYLLASELTKNKPVGLWSAFLMAVGPWSVGLSRGAFEANLATLFLPLAVWLWLVNRRYLSVFCFVLAFYSYHSARLATPFFFLATFIYTKTRINKETIIPLLVFVSMAIPGMAGMFGSAGFRSKDVTIISPTDNWKSVSDRRFASTVYGVPDFISRIFVNKVSFTFDLLYKNSLNYLSTGFWFTSGVNEANYGLIPGRGILYKFEGLFALAFIVNLIKYRQKSAVLLSSLFLIGLIPAILSKGIGLAGNRTVLVAPYVYIMLSMGLVYITKFFSQKVMVYGIFVAYSISVAFFLHEYFYLLPIATARSVGYGWEEVLNRIQGQTDRYSQIKISRTLSEPHIFLAFYEKIDPRQYQKASSTWPDFQKMGFKYLDQYSGYSIGKYYFGDLNYSPDNNPKNILYLGKKEDFTEKFHESFSVNYPDGGSNIIVSE